MDVVPLAKGSISAPCILTNQAVAIGDKRFNYQLPTT